MTLPPREVLVVDCSQLARADAVSAHLVQERDADAGVGPPGPRWIELHNVEHLDGAALEREVDDVRARLAQDDRLTVIRHRTPPRGRLYQHARLRSRQLEGATIERAIAWRPRPDTRQILWILPAEGCWQRLFLDSGFAVWEEYSRAEIDEELDELLEEVVDLDALRGERIGLVIFDDRAGNTEIRVELASGTVVRMFPTDPDDVDRDGDATLELRGPG